MPGNRRIKRCFYEVLGVEKTASDEEIRKNYKLMALKYHPDKNMDNLDGATEAFREVQAAYEVLSNPHERCWYDKHRDVILAGADKDSIRDQCFDVYPYFSSSCYFDYDDSEAGFYTIYREVFEKIAKEDLPYHDDDYEEPPSFGCSSSPYSEVHKFYSFWESYSTPKTFNYLDEYNILDAPNRRVARLMEKENKKHRDAAKKKRNEEIRTLVAFVRRRDRRVKAQKEVMDKQREEKRKKSADHRKKQLETRNKELADAVNSVWLSLNDMEKELQEIEGELDCNQEKSRRKRKGKKTEKIRGNESEELESEVTKEISRDQDQNQDNEENSILETPDKDHESDNSDFYCLACEKFFKSVKAFENHENSKKHRANVAVLKHVLERDEDAIAHDESQDGT